MGWAIGIKRVILLIAREIIVMTRIMTQICKTLGTNENKPSLCFSIHENFSGEFLLVVRPVVMRSPA